MAIFNKTFPKGCIGLYKIIIWSLLFISQKSKWSGSQAWHNSRWCRVSISAVKQTNISELLLALIILCTVATDKSSETHKPSVSYWKKWCACELPAIQRFLSALCRLRLMICSVGLFYFKEHTCSGCLKEQVCVVFMYFIIWCWAVVHTCADVS